MENISSLNVFVQVSEVRSFVEAGRLLGISASAVGKSIARLEEKLDVRLFHRSTRSVALTAEGELFLKRCRRILAEYEAAERELSQSRELPKGRLKVSLPIIGSLFLPVLGGFMKQYPEIELDLDFSDRQVDLIEEGFDAVIRVGDLKDSRLYARSLGRFRSILVASPDYLSRCGTPNFPSDLATHACLHYRFSGTGKLEPWTLRKMPENNEWRLPTTMVCNNIDARIHFALQGLGIGYFPDFAVKRELESGLLCTILNDYVGKMGEFHVLWTGSKHPLPKIRAFVDFLSDSFFKCD